MLPSIELRSWTDTVKLASKINVQIILHHMENFSFDYLALRISHLVKRNISLMETVERTEMSTVEDVLLLYHRLQQIIESKLGTYHLL